MTSPRQTDAPHVPAGIAAADESTDLSTSLSEQRTSLAVERSFLAFERTLMSWLRTSLSMISFGFTLVKFFEYVEDQRGMPVVGRFGRTWASTSLGLAMVVIGTGALIVAVIQHRRRVEALRQGGLLPQWNLALYVATLVAILGAFAFVYLVAGL